MNIKLISLVLAFILVIFVCVGCSAPKNNSSDGADSLVTEGADGSSNENTKEESAENSTGEKDSLNEEGSESSNPGSSAVTNSTNKNQSSKENQTSSNKTEESNKQNSGEADKNNSAQPPKDNNSNENNNSNGSDTEDAPSVEVPLPSEVTYEIYHDMTPTEQQAFFKSFNGFENFFDWYKKAKEQYQYEHPDIEIDGSIDLGGLIG
ncbi:MAG: hypothetical protein E7560_05660 [Ruminococcaceae bacterium]|nr:hypothetical protein [Oscillospiraceae bacterium]